MAEYIEREAVIAKCKEIAACEWNHRAAPVSWADAYEQFAEDVEEMTAADVVEVVHGRWNSRLMKDIGHYWVHWCSACNELSYYEHKFCPNCGARMDGE